MEEIMKKMKEAVERYGKTRVILVLFLAILCAIELYTITLAWQQSYYHNARMRQEYASHTVRQGDIVAPEEISWWMTFTYINFVFHLPANYLEQTLNLDGAEYPNIQIRRYAKLHGLNSDRLVEEVQTAVQNYHP